MKGAPQHVCKHFVKVHYTDYQLIKDYIERYNQGWICKICGKDFLFITSAYKHVIKEHMSTNIISDNGVPSERVIERW